MHANITLSKLLSDRRNPRRVKPERDAHKRLVASIRAFGLLEPLVVRPLGDDGEYHVIAGQRRLAALREVHRNSKDDPKIACQVRKVDDPTAEAMSLSENFAREAMHLLDEAEAFAKLASLEGKGAETIAIEFGVTAHYVRQRMKLATLADVIKAAYRVGDINTSIAEAFTAVPPERQEVIWKELNAHPRHAEQVRQVISSSWIEATHALFDLSVLPEASVSRDLFNEQVLVERSVFLEAQTNALQAQRETMVEEGWKQVIIERREEVQDKLFAMQQPEREFDVKTNRRLTKIQAIREKLESKLEAMGNEDSPAMTKLHQKLDALAAREEAIIKKAPEYISEATKAAATVFLLLGPDGAVQREYRVPRRVRPPSRNGVGTDAGADTLVRKQPLTSENLTDKQSSTVFHQQAMAVRSALLDNAAARKRILVLLLHDKVRSEALAVRQDVNGTTLHATQTEEFSSGAWDQLREKRAAVDPFGNQYQVEDVAAYRKLSELSDAQINALIALLIVESLTAHPLRKLELVQELASELKVELREFWRPDAEWLSSFQKIQLSHLMGELKGPIYRSDDERRKKSEMVEALTSLFSDAAAGKIEDNKLVERVNRWLPTNFTPSSAPA